MRCICSDCLDPNTNLGAALNKGMDGLVELILNVHNTGDFCKEWNECVRKIEAGENIPDDLCNRCIEAWLRAPKVSEKRRSAGARPADSSAVDFEPIDSAKIYEMERGPREASLSGGGQA